MFSKKGKALLIASVLVLAVALIFFGISYLRTTGYASSHVGNLSAGITTYLTCTWSDAALDVGFGNNLAPNSNDVNALRNYDASGSGSSYNVTVDSLSNVQANITIRGSDMIAGINVIGVSNISWASNTSSSNGANMVPGSSIPLGLNFDGANIIAGNEPIGSTVWYRFWLDVPAGQLGGNYKGNYTMQCEQSA